MRMPLVSLLSTDQSTWLPKKWGKEPQFKFFISFCFSFFPPDFSLDIFFQCNYKEPVKIYYEQYDN